MAPSLLAPVLAFLPQTVCGSPGPDLLIGDVTSVANYSSLNGIEACTFGFSPCNLGDAPAAYVASTPAHPVYGSSVYRLKTVDGATRIEEVGQGWLKHGFFALQQDLCCNCSPADGTELGAGCSDTFSASGGAGVIGLGPRWQVDAATGAFPYPPANPPISGLDRLVQVHVADLEATGGAGAARYFVETQVIAADDAAAGNADNNASHRELAVSGSGSAWTFSMLGATERERPALLAWQDADPGVVVNDVHVPGDGRFLLGSRATDLGGGTWHYEYALTNQSSARSGQAFRVALPASVTLANVGFHDVDYHSGDGPGDVNFDGTDWGAATPGGEIVFSTDPFASNPSANALRWSTTYNFRFDADAPPVPGSVTVDLFVPGSPASVAIAAVVPDPGEPPVHPAFCYGDGSGAACPCDNSGSAGHGCQNSAATGGAVLSGTGNANLSGDAVVLSSSGELPTALSIVMQGDTTIAPVYFGDGLRCAGGSIKRLYVKSAVGGSVTAPQAGDPSVSTRSAALGDPIGAGESRDYQIYYRDPNPAWCPAPPGSTFNATGAVSIPWGT